jgi:hypothetical protein
MGGGRETALAGSGIGGMRFHVGTGNQDLSYPGCGNPGPYRAQIPLVSLFPEAQQDKFPEKQAE